MKKIILSTLLFQLALCSVFGQLFNDGAQVTIQQDALLHIQGDFVNLGGEISNEGLIEIAGNWVNTVMTNPLTPGLGNVDLVGMDQFIGGDFPTLFNDLTLRDDQSITLLSNIGIGNIIDINNGLITLDEKVLHILNPNPDGISVGQGGVIAETSENYGFVRWDIGESNEGLYTIPFKNIIEADIPLTFDLLETAEGQDGYLLFSTYNTAEDNTPLPIDVSNIDVDSDNSGILLVDRFWIVNAIDFTESPSGALGFSYDAANEIGGINNIDQNRLEAIYWDESLQTWEGIESNTSMGNVVVSNTNDNFGNFSLWSNETTAVTSVSPFDHFSAHPNPASNTITVNIEGEQSDSRQLFIIDVLGNVLLKSNISGHSDRITQTLDLSSLPSGFYTLLVESQNQRSVLKLNKI